MGNLDNERHPLIYMLVAKDHGKDREREAAVVLTEGRNFAVYRAASQRLE